MRVIAEIDLVIMMLAITICVFFDDDEQVDIEADVIDELDYVDIDEVEQLFDEHLLADDDLLEAMLLDVDDDDELAQVELDETELDD